MCVCAEAMGKPGDDDARIDVAGRIEQLLDEVMNATTWSEADEKTVEAWRLYENISEKEKRLLNMRLIGSDVMRARGCAATRFWERTKDEINLRREAAICLVRAIAGYEEVVKLAKEKAEGIRRSRRRAGLDKDKGWRLAMGQISKARYAIAWCCYNFGVVADNTRAREKALNEAMDIFDEFTSDGYRNHQVVADCFLGTGMCLYQSGRYGEVEQLLAKIKRKKCPRRTYERIIGLRMQALNTGGRDNHAARIAHDYFNEMKDRSHALTLGEVDMAVVWARTLGRLIDSDAQNGVERFVE